MCQMNNVARNKIIVNFKFFTHTWCVSLKIIHIYKGKIAALHTQETLLMDAHGERAQTERQTVLGCIKCSRCFIGVGFIYLTHISTSCIFFSWFQLLQPSQRDPGGDCGPFTILQHVHTHTSWPDRVAPRSGPNPVTDLRRVTSRRHIMAHCITSYRHTRNDLKALVGVLCLLVKTQQKRRSAVTHPPEKPAKITETRGKNKKRDTHISCFFQFHQYCLS